MNDDDKEFLKNIDVLINLGLLQDEIDWDVIQNMDAVVNNESKAQKDKGMEKSDDLDLEEE